MTSQHQGRLSTQPAAGPRGEPAEDAECSGDGRPAVGGWHAPNAAFPGTWAEPVTARDCHTAQVKESHSR